MRVGIIGCGYITDENHIPALLRNKGVEIVTVCDKDENRARNTAKRFGISSYCTDVTDAIEKGVDILDICTPPQTHASLVLQALSADCHVLVEKPLALSVKEADVIIEASRRNNRKLCVSHNSLFNQVFVKALTLLESGALGNILHVDIKYSIRPEDRMMARGFWTHSLPGGIFGEIAPHPVYLQQAVLGNISCVYAVAKKSADLDWMWADQLKVLLESENSTGSINISCNSPRYGATMDIFGTKMNLHLDLWTLAMIKDKPAKFGPFSSALGNLTQSSQLACSTIVTALKYTAGKIHTGHFDLISRFINSIENGTEPPVAAEAGRETVRILETIWDQIDQSA